MRGLPRPTRRGGARLKAVMVLYKHYANISSKKEALKGLQFQKQVANSLFDRINTKLCQRAN